MKLNIQIISFIFLFILAIQINSLPVSMLFEYPYTCGTWFNRGKNTIDAIKNKLQENGFEVDSIVKAFHIGEYPANYNGEFNIYLNRGNEKLLIATSDPKSEFYHSGLKYFAYTFYKTSSVNGERVYLEEFPQKYELLNFITSRMINLFKNNNLRIK